jgi:hypothetical protein
LPWLATVTASIVEALAVTILELEHDVREVLA